MSQGKGYAPHYRETSSMMILAGTMAESISASGTLDKKRAGTHSALDSLLFYYTISGHGAAMLLANAVAPRRGAGGAQSGTSLKLTADR
jgi:hypothetical protein